MDTSRYASETPPAELLDEIRRRLAKICCDWPPELFAEVTIRAAWIEFKYDRAMTSGFPGPVRDQGSEPDSSLPR